MKTLILSVLLAITSTAFAQDFDEDNPPPSSQPPSSAAADGVIWEEEYIPQTPTAPPDGPTKLPPRSVRIQAEVQKIEDGESRIEDGVVAKLEIKLEQDLRLNKTQARRGDTVQVDLMENLKVQRGATLPSGQPTSVQPRTLNDVTVGAKCTLIGHQRRDGVITIGRIELE